MSPAVGSLIAQALYFGVPFGLGLGVGGYMAIPKRRHAAVRVAGIVVVVLTLWLAVVLLLSIPVGTYSS